MTNSEGPATEAASSARVQMCGVVLQGCHSADSIREITIRFLIISNHHFTNGHGGICFDSVSYGSLHVELVLTFLEDEI